MTTYGLPYKGSKNKIADKILEFIPSAENFVDVFAGGCAVTHAAILKGKWKRFFCNDVLNTPEAFLFAVRGGVEKLPVWISKLEFLSLQPSLLPPHILQKLIFSFGTNFRTYLYPPEKVKFKELSIRVITEEDPEKRRLLFKSCFEEFLNHPEIFNSRNSIRNCEILERRNRIKELEKLSKIINVFDKNKKNFFPRRLDYRELKIPENSVIYCDPPYSETEGYRGTGKFNTEEFWEWCRNQKNPVFVSEYSAPPDFVEVLRIDKKCVFSAGQNKQYRVEKLFTKKNLTE